LGLDAVTAADGIVKIVNSQMVEALRLVTVARGEDPAEYAMVAFGGCGPFMRRNWSKRLTDRQSDRSRRPRRRVGNGTAGFRSQA
jgi:N-methylhydantoinase A/oxoprolinase/acetone carboxylase beta subunit